MKRLAVLPVSHFVPGVSELDRERDEDPRGECARYEDCLLHFVGNTQAHCREDYPIPGMPGELGCRFWEPATPARATEYMHDGAPPRDPRATTRTGTSQRAPHRRSNAA